MIPQSFIQDLLARVDIVDVVGRYVQLKKGGANYMGLCPFHNEKSPSFTVSPTKQFYHCFGCGAHGTSIGFLMEYSGLGYVDAIKDLAQNVGMVVPGERRPSAARQARRSAGQKPGPVRCDDPRLPTFTASNCEPRRSAIAYLQKARPDRRDRRPLRAWATRPPAGTACARSSPTTPTMALVESGLVIDKAAEEGGSRTSATTASAIASCSRYEIPRAR